VDLFEELRREYEFGLASISGVARNLSVVCQFALTSSSEIHVSVTHHAKGVRWHQSGWDLLAWSRMISVSRRIIFASSACWS
jgi:hypothetical protein